MKYILSTIILCVALQAHAQWNLISGFWSANVTAFGAHDTEPICTSIQNLPSGDCGFGFARNHPKEEKPLSVLEDSSCSSKYNTANLDDINANFYDAEGVKDYADYSSTFSEAQSYLESCYDTINSYLAFALMNDGCAGMDTDNARWANYREWLKSVLWLNKSDPRWYCACAGSILGTYRSDSANSASNSYAGPDYNAMIAIGRFLLQSGKCHSDSASLVYQDSLEAAERHILWADSVKTLHWSNTLHFPDTANFPEDTTIPTIQQLGLEVLLGPPADVTPTVWQQGTIGDLTASENPFNKETTVSFNMGEYAYISFQLTDVLGHIVQGDFKGTVLPPGDHSFSIDGSTLSSGTYFARITSPSGITRTIKLVRE